MLYFIEPHSLFASDQLIEKSLRPNATAARKYSMIETSADYKISVDVPGVKAEDISVTYDDTGSLSIKSGTKERDFTKSFVIDPHTVQVDAITASITDGVLTVIAPKPEPRPIAVSLAADEDSEPFENNHSFNMTMDVPGVRLEDLSIMLRDTTSLSIQAVRRRRANQQERVFSKTISVDPETYSVSETKASLSYGVLVVSVPRKPQMAPMEIEIDDTPDATIEDDNTGDAGDRFQVSMDLPGVKKSHVSIQVEQNVLRIQAVRSCQNKKKMRLVKETAFDNRRIQRDQFHASLIDGVLTVTAPRTPRPAPTIITVTNRADADASSPVDTEPASMEDAA